jgi:hypothetical protein
LHADIAEFEDGDEHEMLALGMGNVAIVKMEEWTSAIAIFANQGSRSLQSKCLLDCGSLEE